VAGLIRRPWLRDFAANSGSTSLAEDLTGDLSPHESAGEPSAVSGVAVTEAMEDEFSGLDEFEFRRRITHEVSALHQHAIAGLEQLRGEQQQLHGLVTARLEVQVKCLNSQLYRLKQNLFHADLGAVPAAFNGQFSKHRIFRDLCSSFSFEAFVETGANIGITTRFLASFGKPVYSVEINEDRYLRALELLRNEPQVQLSQGDSRDFLGDLTSSGILAENCLAFFYLDAHWDGRLPLREEISVIGSKHPYSIVMIDDFRIEDDEGYGYDVYGSEEITLSFLHEELSRNNWQVFFPTLPSFQDQMGDDILPPRGTAIIARDEKLTSLLKRIASLRRWPL
jgi:hypothetical protein